MLKVDQYSYIRTAHRVYGKKIKQIARETGHSKNTVKSQGGQNCVVARDHFSVDVSMIQISERNIPFYIIGYRGAIYTIWTTLERVGISV